MPNQDLSEPARDCARCPRLVTFRNELRAKHPDWHNAPVPTFNASTETAELLIVGLAPGLRGANRTGRPFTGDYAGDLLYATLQKTGFSHGQYNAMPDDGLKLINCEITNAVRCLPPENKPLPAEVKSCRIFLEAKLSSKTQLRAVIALGQIAHTAVIAAVGARQAAFKFGHANRHELGHLTLFDSYHCSRYNTNTGRLTEQMFHEVFLSVRAHLEA